MFYLPTIRVPYVKFRRRQTGQIFDVIGVEQTSDGIVLVGFVATGTIGGVICVEYDLFRAAYERVEA